MDKLKEAYNMHEHLAAKIAYEQARLKARRRRDSQITLILIVFLLLLIAFLEIKSMRAA